ncbi:unnamed protein product, partial [Rotaria sp. Silwood2]
MNVQTFIYNENFYKKLALTIGIIRLTPSHMTPREFTKQLQNNVIIYTPVVEVLQ